MPELPEVETITTALRRAIGYCKIKQVIIRNFNLRQKIPTDLPKIAAGTSITSYQRRAKYLIINLSNNYSLIWHFGMSGRVTICSEKPMPAKHDHVIIETEQGWLVYNDARRFGMLTYCLTQCLSQIPFLARLGIEPFDSDFTGHYLFEKLKNKNLPIKEALLDQRIVSGIGNIYASETLFGAAISPLRPAGCLSLEECCLLAEEISAVLKKAVAAGGSTLKDYHKPDGSLGYFQNKHCVYNKTGQKCPDCRCDITKTGGIAKIVQAGRSSYYCPVKQK